MCSRYELNGTIEEIELRFCKLTKPQVIKTFNGLAEIRPTDQIPIITNKNEIAYMHWGLSVGWNKSPIINARSETIDQKPVFKAILQNRCIVPATAYFEWRKDGKIKIKTRICRQDKKIISFAGLFVGEKFTIITCPPSPSIAHIHNRMPVILDHADEATWLSPDSLFDKVASLLETRQNSGLLSKEVGEPAKKPNRQPDLFN
jgi:putative SOS response-associated peptidase YedK